LGPIFMFCAPGLVFGGTEGVGSHVHVLRSRTHFRRYRRRRVSFSCFALPESFSTVPSVLGLVFMFCVHGIVFVGTTGVASRFHDLRARTHFRRYRGHRVPFSCLELPETFSAVPSMLGPVFMFCTTGFVFVGTKGVGSRFHVLPSRNRFRRCRGRRVPFSCFALLESFSAVPRPSSPVFMLCGPVIDFSGTEVLGSLFHVLRSPNSFSTVSRASGPVIMFCAPEIVFDGIGGVMSLFHVFRSRTNFRWYRGRRVPFSCFALPESISAVPRSSIPFFMFCPPGIVFSGTGGDGSAFLVLCSRTHFRWY
jgi:hypothetical protein